MSQIRGGKHARQQVHTPMRIGRQYELVDQSRDGIVKSIDVRAAIARGRDMHDRRQVRDGTAAIQKQRRHVLADCLAQAGRGHADEGGLVLTRDVLESCVQILRSAENRRVLVEIRRRDVHRLAEVADEIAPDVGRAALRAMEEGNRPLDAAKDEARTERRAEFTGIARGRGTVREIGRLRFLGE